MPEKQASVMSALGGMNQDDSLLKAGEVFLTDYRYARNCRIGSSIENNTGDVENLPSTLLVSTYLIWNGSAWVAGAAPAGTNTAIGIPYSDKDEGAVYWAVFNSNGDHQVLKFIKSERQIYQLLTWSGLNWTAVSQVSMTKINRFLFIVEGGNPPRIIDTDDIARLKFELSTGFQEYHISLSKWAPSPPALARRGTLTQSEQVKRGIFQFSYRYVFLGGFRSTWSPFSWYVTNQIDGSDFDFDLQIPGFIFDYSTPANTGYNHDTLKFYAFVDFIEIAYRQSERDGWKIYQRYTVDTSANTTFSFKNNGPVATVAASDILQHFDSVPFYSRAVEAIDNRPMLGDNDDELPAHEDFDVEDVEVYTELFNNDQWNGPASAYAGISGPQQVELQKIFDTKQFSFVSGGIYKLAILYQHWTGRTGLAQSLDKWVYAIPKDDQFHALGFNIPAGVTPPDWAVAYQILRTNCLNISYFIYGVCNGVTLLGKAVAAPNPDLLLTPDGAQTIINEFNNSSSEDKVKYPLSERLAAYYRGEVVATTLANASRLYFDIANWTQDNQADAVGTATRPSNNIFYNFQKGDRLIFYGNGVSVDQFDVEIVEYTGNGIIVNKPAGLTTLGDYVGILFSVYRPKEFNTDNILFYEMGEWYPITQPTTPSRDYSKRDFRWTNAASVTQSTVVGHTIYSKMPITNGDSWLVEKEFYYKYSTISLNGLVASRRWDQMNQDKDTAGGYWEHATGRAFVGYRYFPVIFRKETQVRFGGKFLEDSIFLDINHFRDEWQFIYPSEYGRIRRMVNTSNAQVESVGNVLLIHGEAESWSVYVNRTTLEDLSGRTQVSISDKVLGSYNTLLGSQGTLNPESVTVHNGRVVWWNAKEGVWNRYSRDGITEISAIKMKNWFKDISDLLINEYSTGTPPRVISIFDSYHDEWITRFDHSSLPGTFKGYESYKCISFSEMDAQDNGRRWKSVYDFAPDMFAELDNEVYSIIGSGLHIHEAGATFGSIYGSAVPSQIEFAMADAPRQVKLPRVVILDAQDGWSFERIIADHKSNSATVQETRIPLTSLELKEGVYWAEIKRDKNSPNAASETAGVVNGNEIKTKTLRFFLQLDPAVNYLTVLSWLSCEYDVSPKNPKI